MRAFDCCEIGNFPLCLRHAHFLSPLIIDKLVDWAVITQFGQPKSAPQHMPMLITSQLEDNSQNRLEQSQRKVDATCSEQPGSAPDPAEVVRDIRAGLMGLNAAKFSDAVLKTPDNQSVYVCRALLAVRSSFFAKLFFSDFAEHKEVCVAIGVLARPLKHIVEFAYTGNSTLVRNIASSLSEHARKRANNNSPHPASLGHATESLDHTEAPMTPLFSEASLPKHPTSSKREIHRAEVTDLVELAATADYCDITALKKWCFKTLDTLIRINKKTACTALEALDTRVWDEDGDMMSRKSLLQFIANHPESCLLVPDCKTNPVHVNFNIGDCMGALELSAKSLNELLEIKFLEVQEKRSRRSLHSEYLFQVIYFWASNGRLLLKNEQVSDPKMKKSRSGLWNAVANEAVEKLTEDINGLADRVKLVRQEQDGPRWASAKAMMNILDLKKMRSSFLRDYVEGSGLARQTDILAAYRHHATHSEEFLLDNGYFMNSNGDIAKNDNPFGIVPV